MKIGQRIRVFAVHADGRKWDEYGQEGVVVGKQEVEAGVPRLLPVVLDRDEPRGLVMYFAPEHLAAVPCCEAARIVEAVRKAVST